MGIRSTANNCFMSYYLCNSKPFPELMLVYRCPDCWMILQENSTTYKNIRHKHTLKILSAVYWALNPVCRLKFSQIKAYENSYMLNLSPWCCYTSVPLNRSFLNNLCFDSCTVHLSGGLIDHKLTWLKMTTWLCQATRHYSIWINNNQQLRQTTSPGHIGLNEDKCLNISWFDCLWTVPENKVNYEMHTMQFIYSVEG